MKTASLETANPRVRLTEPDVERDAALGVKWLRGDEGRNTLRLMGVPDKYNKPSSLEAERQRVQQFIDRPDQLNWMIAYDNQVVGAVWVDLKSTQYLQSPSVHIMIGDPAMRGKGIGAAATQSVIDYLAQMGAHTIYSRHLLSNTGSAALLNGLDFRPEGPPYQDQDGLNYQNVVLEGKL